MTFEDTIEIEAQTYGVGYAIIGGKAYQCNDAGEITNERVDVDVENGIFDKDMNPIEPYADFFPFSKCFISFNSSAQRVRSNDGKEYIYSYYVIAPLKKSIYHLIPREGDRVRIRKADGTIDKEMEVKGFVTYKKSYLKIWL